MLLHSRNENKPSRLFEGQARFDSLQSSGLFREKKEFLAGNTAYHLLFNNDRDRRCYGSIT